MARMSSQTEKLPFSPKMVFRAAENVAENLNWEVTRANPNEGNIIAKTGATWKAFGESINISIIPESVGCSIIISSKLTSQLYDWGKNSDNVKDFFSRLSLEILKFLDSSCINKD